MTLCASCRTVSTPASPAPVEAMRECAPLPDVQVGMTLDDLLRWAGISIETHNRCIADHHALRSYVRGKK